MEDSVPCATHRNSALGARAQRHADRGLGGAVGGDHRDHWRRCVVPLSVRHRELSIAQSDRRRRDRAVRTEHVSGGFWGVPRHTVSSWVSGLSGFRWETAAVRRGLAASRLLLWFEPQAGQASLDMAI